MGHALNTILTPLYKCQFRITYREWQKVQREVDGAFMNARKETRTKVMALQLEIRNALHLDGNIQSSALICDGEDTSYNIDMAFQSIVTNYRKSFTPMRGNFNPVKRSLSIPNRNVRARQPHKRLMPRSEQFNLSFKKAKRVKPTCGFCRQENHRIGTCPKKEQFRSKGEEFVLCNDEKSKFQCQQLINKLETCRNVFPWDYRKNAINDIDVTRGYKHIIIHEAYSFVISSRVDIRSMFFKVGFIDGSGNEVEDNGELFFSGEGVERFLHNATKRSRTGKVFVYVRCNIASCDSLSHTLTCLTPQQLLLSPTSNWPNHCQQITPDDRDIQKMDKFNGTCLDMNDV